jgi:hypothetical protein
VDEPTNRRIQAGIHESGRLMSQEVSTPTISQLEALLKQAQYVEKLQQRIMLSAAAYNRSASPDYWRSLNLGLKGLKRMERSAWKELAQLRKLMDSTESMLNSDLEFVRIWAEANSRIYRRRFIALISLVCTLGRDIALVHKRAATGEW